jgi:hypothetical protein
MCRRNHLLFLRYLLGPTGLVDPAVGWYLVEELMLVERLTAGMKLFLVPDEKLFEEATGRGILDFFVELLGAGGLTFDPLSSAGLDLI